jgi:uncharacterized protein
MSSKSIKRIIPVDKILKRKGILLLGPRRTGKSFFINHQLHPDKTINLLESDTFRKMSAHPELLRQIITKEDKIVAIDEIQKLPQLMDEVHHLIESTGIRFILTGSSARKLSKSYTSLMAGRLKKMHFHPLVSAEIPDFDLEFLLQYGSLPPVYFSEDPWDELRDYAGLYLKEEIMAEALIRKIENFSRFIEFAAMTNAEILNYESIARDAQVPARTIREYYGLLEDTLIGSVLHPLKTQQKRQSISAGKFYFFDLGVLNSILGRKSLSPHTKEFGELFESFIYLELKAYVDYFAPDTELNFWKMRANYEVDFVINKNIAIEVKSSEFIQDKHLKGLREFAQLFPVKRMIVVSRDKEKRTIGQIEVMPYREFLTLLWQGELWGH